MNKVGMVMANIMLIGACVFAIIQDWKAAIFFMLLAIWWKLP